MLPVMMMMTTMMMTMAMVRREDGQNCFDNIVGRNERMSLSDA